VKDVRRMTPRKFSAEEKIPIVPERRASLSSAAVRGCPESLITSGRSEAGKKRLAGDTARAATSDEVKDLHRGGLGEMAHGQNMEHIRSAPYHPMTQGKSECWHQTLKNRILLENYYLPGDLETQIEAFVADYSHLRYHDSIGNPAPEGVYFERGQAILSARERIKRQTIATRRLLVGTGIAARERSLNLQQDFPGGATIVQAF
jgi:putative transposase